MAKKDERMDNIEATMAGIQTTQNATIQALTGLTGALENLQLMVNRLQAPVTTTSLSALQPIQPTAPVVPAGPNRFGYTSNPVQKDDATDRGVIVSGVVDPATKEITLKLKTALTPYVGTDKNGNPGKSVVLIASGWNNQVAGLPAGTTVTVTVTTPVKDWHKQS